MRLVMVLLTAALLVGAGAAAVPTASAAHCGHDPVCMIDNVRQCLFDALERWPPQFWCPA